MIKKVIFTMMVFSLVVLSACEKKENEMKFTGAKGEVKIITLDPGHFHAALVQKTMYDEISPNVYVYAPKGVDVEDHLKRIEGFNTRKENPTSWVEEVYRGDDFLEKMAAEKKGNVVVISGNNRKKAEYIKDCVEAGLNVLADKPMCIDEQGRKLLEQAFEMSKQKGVLVYDIMTERSEITSILQKKLAHNTEVFGELIKGTVDNPAVVKESVHHFFKYVAGKPNKRPEWYFDTTQQGEGIVDVTTHLIDLIMWGALPGESIDYDADIEINKAKRWPTMITRQQYQKATGLKQFPDFLKDELNDNGVLPCYANGSIDFTLKGIHANASVTWNFQAPEGAKDTHYSIMRGTKSNIIIRQGKEQNYEPELYIEATGAGTAELEASLKKAIASLQSTYPGVKLVKEGEIWHVEIPKKYRIGHEAHFGEVVERYLGYLKAGKMPEWEIANMKTKYRLTTEARKMAMRTGPKVELVQGKDKIDVKIDGRLFTTYLYRDELTKPVLWPVYSTSGIQVNRSYPFANVEGENQDHPHHQGIFFTYGNVNDVDYWGNPNSPPKIKLVEITEVKSGQEGKISSIHQWTDKEGKVVLEEKRDMVFSGDVDAYTIDFDMTLTAKTEEVVFKDTKEGMFAIRVAPWLREDQGAEYLNSNGQRKSKECWGRRARWVRLEGDKDGKKVGVAILVHPGTVNYPVYWHARGYGLFSCNPLGQFSFQNFWKEANPQAFNMTLKKGQSARFKFRMVIYEGSPSSSRLEQMFEEFVK